jgi:hypothetical protein
VKPRRTGAKEMAIMAFNESDKGHLETVWDFE